MKEDGRTLSCFWFLAFDLLVNQIHKRCCKSYIQKVYKVYILYVTSTKYFIFPSFLPFIFPIQNISPGTYIISDIIKIGSAHLPRQGLRLDVLKRIVKLCLSALGNRVMDN